MFSKKLNEKITKKSLVVAVILLFIGVALAPSINAKMNNEPIPDLDCEGELYWDGKDLEPGDVLTGEFTVENIGEPNSELDWRIMSCPFWGTWTFDPESGTGLTPEDGFLTVDVKLILAIEINETIGGEIGIQNVENENDICYIDTVIQKKSVDDELVDIEVLDWIRHPILYVFVKFIALNRLNRFIRLRDIAYDVVWADETPSWHIYYPLLFIWCIWLVITDFIWVGGWDIISDKLGWNWDMPFP